jgi:fibronectin-binding autotransporter adhesin
MKPTLILFASLLSWASAAAAVKTWSNGGADLNWNNPANWSPSGVPVNGDDLVFPAGSDAVTNNNLSGRTFGSLTIQDHTTIQGNAFTLTGGIVCSPGGTGGTVVIEPNLTLGASQTFTSGGGGLSTLTFAGNVLFGPHQLTLAGARPLTFSGLTGSSSAGAQLLRTGGGQLRFGPSAIFLSPVPFTWTTGTLDVDGTFQAPLLLTGGRLTGAGTLGLGLEASGGTIIPDEDDLQVSGATVLRGNVDLRVELTGPSDEHALACTGGSVTIQDQATLTFATNTYTPVRGDSFLVLSKSTAGPITGTFSNLPEATELADETSLLRASYLGGNGNDLALTTVATTRTWDGGATLNDNWDDADNWTNNVAPQPGDILVFPTGIGSTDRGMNNNFFAGAGFRQIIFNGDDFTVRGNFFRLTHGLTVADGATVNLDTDVGLLEDQTFTLGINSTLHLDLLDKILTAGHRLSFTGPATADDLATVDGTISGTGDIDIASGNVKFSANSDYTGLTTIQSGASLLIKDRSNALGSPVGSTLVRGLLRCEVQGTDIATDEPIVLEGGTLHTTGSGTVFGTIAEFNLRGSVKAEGTAVTTLEANPHCNLRLSDRLHGPAPLQVNLARTVIFSGDQANTFTGPLTVTALVQNGSNPLILDKSAPGLLAISCAELNLASSAAVEIRQDEQIADNCHVQMGGGSELRIGNNIGRIETIGQVTMNSSNDAACAVTGPENSRLNLMGNFTAASGSSTDPHRVRLASAGAAFGIIEFRGAPCEMNVAAFAVGIELTFAGVHAVGSGGARIRKTGAGVVRWNLAAVPMEIVAGGMEFIGDGSGCAITLNGGEVSGNQRCGGITSLTAGGRIAPGVVGVGVLGCGSIFLNAATTLDAEVKTNITGTGFDQLSVTGSVSLNNAALELAYLTGFNLAIGQGIFPVLNDGTDAIVGTFAGLPQGAFIPIPAAHGGGGWTISYTGGTGNDVSLTRVAAPPPTTAPEVTGFSLGTADQNGNRPASFTARGVPGVTYQLQQSAILTGWTTVQTQVAAPTTGALSFSVNAAVPVNPTMFFRLVLP